MKKVNTGRCYDIFSAMRNFAEEKETRISWWTYAGEEPEDNIGIFGIEFPNYPFEIMSEPNVLYHVSFSEFENIFYIYLIEPSDMERK